MRPLGVDDLPVLYDLASDLSTWSQRNPEPPHPLTYDSYENAVRQRLLDESVTEFGIVVDDRLVGRCVLFHDDLLSRSAEVGIGLVSSHRGHGYGTDALRVLCEFAFERRNLRRLQLEVLATNLGAVASYRKVGFVEEGRRREAAWADGRYTDAVIMGVLRRDWRAAR